MYLCVLVYYWVKGQRLLNMHCIRLDVTGLESQKLDRDSTLLTLVDEHLAAIFMKICVG